MDLVETKIFPTKIRGISRARQKAIKVSMGIRRHHISPSTITNRKRVTNTNTT